METADVPVKFKRQGFRRRLLRFRDLRAQPSRNQNSSNIIFRDLQRGCTVERGSGRASHAGARIMQYAKLVTEEITTSFPGTERFASGRRQRRHRAHTRALPCSCARAARFRCCFRQSTKVEGLRQQNAGSTQTFRPSIPQCRQRLLTTRKKEIRQLKIS